MASTSLPWPKVPIPLHAQYPGPQPKGCPRGTRVIQLGVSTVLLVVAAGAKGLCGSGTTSSSLLSVLEEQASMLERDQDVQLDVVGVIGDQGVLFNKEGMNEDCFGVMLGKSLQGWTSQRRWEY